MNKNVLSIGILVGIIIILSAIFIAERNSNSNTPIPVTPENTTSAAVQTTGSTNDTTSTTTGSAEKSYSLAEVGTHNSQSSCWTAINGNVYDVTSWISRHPGGSEAILSLCGIDGTTAFNGQHGGQARPENELATFKIGVLK